jgi:RNA polymerase sigma-70 factor (ECF subfamily)
MARASDEELLLQWREGDTRSGEALFDRYYGPVSRFFANKVQRERDDLVQATFSACLEKVDGLRTASSFRSFLFGIARFELLHHYRRKTKQGVSLDTERDSVCDLDPSPSLVVAKRQEQRLLLEALRRIPLQLQIVLELSYWEQLTSAEVAEIIDVPVGTVKSRLRRARERLEAAMAEVSESPALLASTTANLDAWAGDLKQAVMQPASPPAA